MLAKVGHECIANWTYLYIYLFLSYKKSDENENWPCMHVARKLDIVLVFGRDRGNTNTTNW